MTEVSVLVLNFNGKDFILPCMRSVLAQDYPLHEILIVDNGSTDGSVSLVEKKFPEVRLLKTGENLGFAGGMNFAIDRSKGDMLLLLNPDVVLDPMFVGRLVRAIEDKPDFGSASGKVYRPPVGERRIIDTTGHLIFVNRLFTDRGEDEVDRGQYDREEEVFGVCAGIGLYKREMLEDVKEGHEYFDESFFLFLEDTDLNWRAQLKGWKCLYVPTAIAWHHRGGTAKRRTKLVETHNYKNRYMMLIKNDSFSGLIMNIHHLIITDTLKSAALLWRCPAALLGWFSVLRQLPALWRKRRIIQANRRISGREFNHHFVPFNYGRWIRSHLKGD